MKLGRMSGPHSGTLALKFLSYSHLSQTWVSSVNAVLINFFYVYLRSHYGLQEVTGTKSKPEDKHCFRGNQCADSLSRKGALKQQDFVVFNNPPLDIKFKLFWLINISILYYPPPPPKKRALLPMNKQ